MKEILTFQGINVDVLTITKVSPGMLILETECPFTAVTYISTMTDAFWIDSLPLGEGISLDEDTNAEKLSCKYNLMYAFNTGPVGQHATMKVAVNIIYYFLCS